jgi:hypothetical protein
MNYITLALITVILTIVGQTAAGQNPFVGQWALTLPSGGPGWLGVAETGGQLTASILWGGGSVKPVTSVTVNGNQLVITRAQVQRTGKDKGKKVTETIAAKQNDNQLKLVTVKTRPDGKHFARAEFTGQRTTMPAKPDLSKVKLGNPIHLLNAKDLTG